MMTNPPDTAQLVQARRVLIVDDNRDGADALGLVVEAFGNLVHVTYGGPQALDVATAFRPDLMLIDIAMPGMDGCALVKQFRLSPQFVPVRIVAITGSIEDGRIKRALKAGFDEVLLKPVSLAVIRATLTGIDPTSASPGTDRGTTTADATPRLPIGEARRLRVERPSKLLTLTESEAAISEGIIRFQEEYLGWHSTRVQTHFVKDLLIVRIFGVLTLAETQLGKSASPESGRDLIKRVRKQLLELARPMLESLVHEITGVKVLSMHHDISTVTGEEIVAFTLVGTPRLG
jgi:CheY-like chemotaxis protein/uncharacterized protein YbcI